MLKVLRINSVKPLPNLLRPFKSFWEESYTKAWAYVQVFPGAVLASITAFNGWVTDPTIKSYLDQLDLPKTVSVGLIVLGIITYAAHGHGDDT